MPQDRAIPGTPQDWLDHAKSDLAFARLPLREGAYYEGLCFHAQQAAEKALKAVYQHHSFAWEARYPRLRPTGGRRGEAPRDCYWLYGLTNCMPAGQAGDGAGR